MWLENDFDDLVDEFMCDYDGEVENEDVIEQFAIETIKNYDWEKVIVVYIELP